MMKHLNRRNMVGWIAARLSLALGSLAGAVASFARYRYAGAAAMALGVFLIAWILVQVYRMAGFHWLHWLYLSLGIVEAVLGWSVRRTISRAA